MIAHEVPAGIDPEPEPREYLGWVHWGPNRTETVALFQMPVR